MKITNIRSNDLVERNTNNNLTEDDKNILMEIFTPKKYTKHKLSEESVKKHNERRRLKYHNDEEYRLNKIEKTKQRYARKFEELGIERKPKGRPRIYETPEESRKANLENIKRLYYKNNNKSTCW